MQKAIIYDEVFDAQLHYRMLLDSMARPGKINVLHDVDVQQIPAGINKTSLLIALALLNTDASFYVEEKTDNEIAKYIALHSSAPMVSVQNADFVFVSGLQYTGLIPSLKRGTLSYPEDSATIIIDVDSISSLASAQSLQLTLKGPGVKDTQTIYLTGLNPAILDDVKEQNMEFPLGIDLILTDNKNCIVCIPRSNEITYITNSTTDNGIHRS